MSVSSHISPVGGEARIEYREEVAPGLSLERPVVFLPWVAGRGSGGACNSVNQAHSMSLFAHPSSLRNPCEQT